jgi:hypothetical protein
MHRAVSALFTPEPLCAAFYTSTDGTIALQKYNKFRILQNKTTIIFGGLQNSMYICSQISFS